MKAPGRVTLTFDIAVMVGDGNLSAVQELVQELPALVTGILEYRPDVTEWTVTRNLDLPRDGTWDR